MKARPDIWRPWFRRYIDPDKELDSSPEGCIAFQKNDFPKKIKGGCFEPAPIGEEAFEQFEKDSCEPGYIFLHPDGSANEKATLHGGGNPGSWSANDDSLIIDFSGPAFWEDIDDYVCGSKASEYHDIAKAKGESLTHQRCIELMRGDRKEKYGQEQFQVSRIYKMRLRQDGFFEISFTSRIQDDSLKGIEEFESSKSWKFYCIINSTKPSYTREND